MAKTQYRYQVPRASQCVRLPRPVDTVLLPLVRTRFGKVAGPGQIENRSTCEKSTRVKYDLSRRNDRKALDVQQRRGNSAVPREYNNKRTLHNNVPLETVYAVNIFYHFIYLSYRVYADEGILETPRLAEPDPVVQFRIEITRRNVVCSFL